ncbi:uncharacterized protein [Palaemon carinicauda]|uniref:uncharacterized protein n=3 Tax=Palaemon carinicauda TaxID=392227 RepID=UPI0035B5BFA2
MDEEIEDVLIAYSAYRTLYKRKKRRMWIHPLLAVKTRYFPNLFAELRNDENKFFNYFRMSKDSFDELLSHLQSSVEKEDTNMRQAIKPSERLGITLRYLGSGCSMADLHYSHKIGYSTVQSIIKEVCSQIWNVLLNECMPKPSQENWLRICTDFEKNAHFPNCLGAVDGKHIRIIKPSDSGSLYYNYKNFFSLVLLAVCDADYCFTYIDVGSYGKESDSNIFKNSDFYQLLESNNLNIPESATVEDQRGQIPYVFVADEAFSLSQQILRPYSGNQLTEIKKIFNYRLCRARRYIECTFGILANKWRIFHRPLNVSVELAEIITRACCILHNFVRKRDGHRYHDSANNPNDKTGLGNILSAENVQGGRNANKIRDSFASYFVTEEGALPWQYEKM